LGRNVTGKKYICMCIYVCIYIYIYMCVCVCVCVCVNVCVFFLYIYSRLSGSKTFKVNVENKIQVAVICSRESVK